MMLCKIVIASQLSHKLIVVVDRYLTGNDYGLDYDYVHLKY